MKNKQHRELAVCGFEAVKALADMHPERIQRLFFTQENARFFGSTCKMLAAARKIYRCVESPEELEKLSQSVHHQGVVAMIDEPTIPILDFSALRGWFANKERILVLDRVGNANNLGAIVRSAAFFGIRKVVIGADDAQAQITTSAYRVAEGGMEHVEMWRAPSAAWIVQGSARKMVRIGADHRASRTLADLGSRSDPELGLMIVMGNEEFGLSPEVTESCDHLVRIPGSGAIESLNVAQAATLFLYGISLL